MLNFTCLCGGVRVRLQKRPEYIHECNCTLCNKSGARWAYLGPQELSVEGETQGWRRADKAEANAEIHFCPTCGSTTHFRLTEAAVARFGDTLAGVNLWLADPDDLAGVELRYPDGRAWAGDGPFDYVRPPVILGPATAEPG